ncbi:MAG TPA: YeeE/YedE thiosulfate transporter family protein [Desulfovibrio sp.]|uniref:YeeE/YedE thiosulfate transporter family protein n=1 Tax=Desulfovibrio TaxID=872 RepID=UPI00040CE324|nr:MULTISPECIES: YeeE/YedE thiosulfate transporter family protein [Desulfovibrio]MDY0304874.1 YeeE/YedE thiosulfate transporter family protein [Desulfovibrionaceae bacterium]HMM39305.1 YeeE/YedE thiosulfate transporter family protein [Desulfovibrio sp.]
MDLWYGLFTGVLFGALLQRCEVIRYDRQLGALRLRDMTIVKFMLSTVVVGMIGVYLLFDLGLVKLSVKAAVLGGVIPGGLLFGMGWGLVGYCPGTAAGALGEGRLDAFWAILGMFVGAGLYAEAYPALKAGLLTWGDYGKITLPQVVGVNHWPIIAMITLGALLLFRWFEKKGL